MLSISPSDRSASGGLLAALADKSVSYVNTLLGPVSRPQPDQALSSLDRIIVHTDPHLDEYLADLLFRACLPPDKWSAESIEQAIFSSVGDSGCRLLWPTAAVLGIGSNVSGGVQPLFLFDEHVSGQSRVAPSCSQIVLNKMLNEVPPSLNGVLREVNAIDEFGGAHPQSLSILIRGLHQVRVPQSEGDGLLSNSTGLTVEWKRAILNACLAAVIYCNATGIDLIDNPDEKRKALDASLTNYLTLSPHRGHEKFDQAAQRLRSIFGDQRKVFEESFLKDRAGPILDGDGNKIPQILIFSRVCYALEQAWGAKLRDMVATHFWESELQRQLQFYEVEDALYAMVRSGKGRADSDIGVLWRDILPAIDVIEVDRRSGHSRQRRKAVWLLGLVAAPGLTSTNQALQSFLNHENGGCGLLLIQNPALGTTALFKGSSVPEAKWRTLVELLNAKEPECWHVIYNSAGTIAPFVLNGNKAHQYVPRSALDGNVLQELVRRTFY